MPGQKPRVDWPVLGKDDPAFRTVDCPLWLLEPTLGTQNHRTWRKPHISPYEGRRDWARNCQDYCGGSEGTHQWKEKGIGANVTTNTTNANQPTRILPVPNGSSGFRTGG